jgi:hypothetical protein
MTERQKEQLMQKAREVRDRAIEAVHEEFAKATDAIQKVWDMVLVAEPIPPKHRDPMLAEDIRLAVKQLGGSQFTWRHIKSRLDGVASRHSIGNVIRRLRTEGVIEVALEGSGRRPTRYRASTVPQGCGDG